jgi:hypothetical protein
LPASFVRSSIPELDVLPVGSVRPIAVQLALLPPRATDVMQHTEYLDLRQGVLVRKRLKANGRNRALSCISYRLTGVALRRAAPVQQGWFMRGTCCHSDQSLTAGLPYVAKESACHVFDNKILRTPMLKLY